MVFYMDGQIFTLCHRPRTFTNVARRHPPLQQCTQFDSCQGYLSITSNVPINTSLFVAIMEV